MEWPKSTVPSLRFSETTESALDDEDFRPGLGIGVTAAMAPPTTSGLTGNPWPRVRPWLASRLLPR